MPPQVEPDIVCGQDGCDRCEVCPVPIPVDAFK